MLVFHGAPQWPPIFEGGNPAPCKALVLQPKKTKGSFDICGSRYGDSQKKLVSGKISVIYACATDKVLKTKSEISFPLDI